MIDLYIPRQSWLHETDARVKLVGIGGALIVLFLAKNLLFMGGVLLVMTALYGSARIPLAKLMAVCKTLLPVSALMTVMWVLFYPSGTPILELWVIRITALSIAQGLALGLRILNIGLVVTLWLYTTDSVAIVQSLVKLGVPFHWGLVLALALRYIPFVQESYTTISEAQQARGLNISSGKGFQRARMMLPIFVAMIISTLRASDHVGKALEARGFGVRGTPRSSLNKPEAKPRDLVLTCILLVGFIAFLWLYFASGFATQAISL